MPDQKNPFTKLHVEEVTPAKRTLLDELNLPPKLRLFILDHAKILQAAVVLIIVITAGSSFYNYYTEKQRNNSAALLAQAMEEKDAAARNQELSKVIADYPRSGAATWSRIAQAHELVDKKDYAKALEQLTGLMKDAGQGSPLYPLLALDAAQVHELHGDLDQALAQYTSLREIPGFAVIGALGEARLYEEKKEAPKAREIYEQLKSQADLDPAVRDWVMARLAVK